MRVACSVCAVAAMLSLSCGAPARVSDGPHPSGFSSANAAVSLDGGAAGAPADPGAPLIAAPPPGGSRAANDRDRPDDPDEDRLIGRVLSRVETARGLRAKQAVSGVRLPRGELIQRVRGHVARELPPEAIRNEGLVLQLFGFLPAQFDYEKAEYQLLQDQLAGFYEPSDHSMYMASDLGDEEASATLAHELVHALQDQHWDLEVRSKYHAGDGDRAASVSALAEGDATSAMFDVMIRAATSRAGKTALDIPDETFVAQIEEGLNQGPAGAAPHVMRSSLAAPYIYGTLFVNALRRRGGWAAVDGAWNEPPATTEQILHVEKWLAHEPAAAVLAPTFAILGPGWVASDEDSEGELGARIAFQEWMDAPSAAKASDGWGGDRGVLLAHGDEAAFAWRLRYDGADGPPKQGQDRSLRAYDAIQHALTSRLGHAESKSSDFVCHERADRGPIALTRVGRDLVLTLGPVRVGSPGWQSRANCALARAWASEIVRSTP